MADGTIAPVSKFAAWEVWSAHPKRCQLDKAIDERERFDHNCVEPLQ
jgi:hypothetical protein